MRGRRAGCWQKSAPPSSVPPCSHGHRHRAEAAATLQPGGPPRSPYAFSPGAHVLCLLLRGVLRQGPHRPRSLLFLALSAELVQRVWFSVMRPAREAEARALSSHHHYQPPMPSASSAAGPTSHTIT
ncbi:hypothetical protein FOA52_016019 [Chlamydomonas sp. UWO 241]|nr:hypothetical protein FOA52_016019 [Chlamydomonas sp. UWO 241]